MLNNLLPKKQKKDDICPSCGTACFATDILCPHCGKNLDELFEQFPHPEESNNLFHLVSARLSFLNWFTPVCLMLLPVLICLLTTLSFARYSYPILAQGPFPLIVYVLPSVVAASSSSLVFSAILLLGTAFHVWKRLNLYMVVIFLVLFSSLSLIKLWTDLQTSHMMSVLRSAAFLGVDIVFLSPMLAYIFAVGALILVVLNSITVIEQRTTA